MHANIYIIYHLLVKYTGEICLCMYLHLLFGE